MPALHAHYRCLRTALCAFVFVAGAGANVTARAMTFDAAPPILYLGGAVVPSDWAAWQEAMTRFGNDVDTIVFHDSGGGDSMAGRNIGNDIRKRSLKTVVSGRCSSACANMFLGGVERQYAGAGKTANVLGYHGSYNKITKALNRNKSADYFLEMTGGKMSEEFVEKFIRLENKSGLLRFFHPDQRLRAGQALALLCKGDENRERRDAECEKLTDVDALKQGVVTTWTVREIPAPPRPVNDKVTVKRWVDGSLRADMSRSD
ncbi:MAG: hypothetical protein ABI905_04575 [Betaproteobacteria bacterium]